MANRTYEVMYIVNPETDGDKIEKLNEAVGKLIEKEGGEVVRMDDIGMRNLAYPIQKKDERALCPCLRSTARARRSLELERRMRVNDMIMRYITVRVDEDRKKAEKIKAKTRSPLRQNDFEIPPVRKKRRRQRPRRNSKL